MVAANESLASYRLIERIGAGGMGQVWKAEDTRLGRLVAIKILPPEVASDAEAIARLRREARTAAQLNHPNIATIHSIEEAKGRIFVVMEFVHGEPLSKLMRRGIIPESELFRIGKGVAEALAEAHANGIVHRDIKPDNIVVSPSRVKVLDFGIAKQIGPVPHDAKTATFMTQQGVILGTVQYMSPEQALGKPLDARTDIFSLGVVLYEAATGRLPFQGETITDTITRIIRDEAKEPTAVNPGVSKALSAIIKRCMRKNREARYPNASDLSRAFDQNTVLTGSLLKTVKEPARRSWRWGWVVALAVLVLAGAVIFSRLGGAPAPSPAGAPAPHKAVPIPTSVTRQELFAQLRSAIAERDRPKAEAIAREIQRRWPGDPELERIRRARRWPRP